MKISTIAALGFLGLTNAAQNAIEPITDWGENPSGLTLHVYVPPKLAPKSAIILAV